MKKVTLLFFVLFITQHSFAKDAKEELNLFMQQIVGSYSSIEQASVDSYFIDLHLNVQEIWDTSDSSRWLFLQTSFSYDTLYPYKHQLFHLYPIALNLIRIDVYKITDKKSLIQTVDSNLVFDTTFRKFAEKLNNCELYLNKVNSTFAAYSKSDRCDNNLRGATYSNTDIELDGNELYVWERGYNASKEQVWGPLNGGYIFKKLLPKAKREK